MNRPLSHQSLQEMCNVLDIMLLDEQGIILGASPAALRLMGLIETEVVGRPLMDCIAEMNQTYFRGLRYGSSDSILSSALAVSLETGWFNHVCWLADPEGRTQRCQLMARRVPSGVMLTLHPLDDFSSDKQTVFLDRQGDAVETRSGERYDWHDLEILTEIILGKSIVETAEYLEVTEGRIRYRLGRMLSQSGINDVGALRSTVASWYVDATFPSPACILNGFPSFEATEED